MRVTAPAKPVTKMSPDKTARAYNENLYVPPASMACRNAFASTG